MMQYYRIGETLELLEDILQQYQGTVLLVSHDREFVNNTVTSSLYFAGQGRIVDIAGDYEDVLAYQQRQANQQKLTETPQKLTKQQEEKPNQTSSVAAKKLSYKEKRELEQLPALIEELDAQITSLQQQVNDPEFFRQDAISTQATLNQLHEAESKLAHAYERWEQLEAMNS